MSSIKLTYSARQIIEEDLNGILPEILKLSLRKQAFITGTAVITKKGVSKEVPAKTVKPSYDACSKSYDKNLDHAKEMLGKLIVLFDLEGEVTLSIDDALDYDYLVHARGWDTEAGEPWDHRQGATP